MYFLSLLFEKNSLLYLAISSLLPEPFFSFLSLVGLSSLFSSFVIEDYFHPFDL
jgi:hypothetical protein